jgi:[ribosomal protein S18]-alanine N-acetyltransferase
LDQRCLGGMWNSEGYRREMDSPQSDLLIARGAESSTSILALGCSWAILEEAHITLLAVEPAHQRQGLGQLMLYALLQSSIERGLERATLEVRSSNQAALALYQQFGFSPVGERRRYYPDGEDATILWLGGLHRPGVKTALEERLAHIQRRLTRSNWQW